MPDLNPKVPPKGSANVTMVVLPVPHGWKIAAEVKNLLRSGSPGIPEDLYPLVCLWTDITRRLRDRGMDMQQALDNLPGEEG